MPHSRKIKKQANDFLSLGQKVYHFRRDQMSEKQQQTLKEKLQSLREALKSGEGEDSAIQARMETLDPLLKKTGGRLYPRTFWNDNVEMLLVAAIVVLGIRAFIVQPFIIPTNSMYPSYAGITHRLYAPEVKPPGILSKTWGLVTRGARNRTVTAPASGELILPVFDHLSQIPIGGSGSIRYREIPGRTFGVWPTVVREYELLIGDQGHSVKLRVPRGFRLDEIVGQSLQTNSNNHAMRRVTIRGEAHLRTGIQVEAGQTFLNFDIQLGDMLFVERMSYHFKKPEVGDPFVFRTGDITGLVDRAGNPEDKYYIKRLVGIPGDRLNVRDPVLFRNGEPIQGAPAFEKNHNREGEFPGYTTTDPVSYASRRSIPIPQGSMQKEQTVPIPNGYYYAMGDNSPESLDSRAWGYVPEKAVIGRAFFVYYPFTSRWGPGR